MLVERLLALLGDVAPPSLSDFDGNSISSVVISITIIFAIVLTIIFIVKDQKEKK